VQVPLIAFLSDFGISDPYVAMVKGVIFTLNPHARVIDITHAISSQDVRQAAFVLKYSMDVFPSGTIFLSVVDPGVGSSRAGIIVQDNGRLFVGPDNGIFSAVLDNGRYVPCIAIDNTVISGLAGSAGYTPEMSMTFHARDVFGPAAAMLSLGTRPGSLGTPLQKPVILRFPEPEIVRQEILGCIVYFDHFGNAITNIPASLLDDLHCRPGEYHVMLTDRSHEPIPFVSTYSQAAPGQLRFLVNSFNLLEIAVNCGSARHKLGLELDEGVRVVCGHAEKRHDYPGG